MTVRPAPPAHCLAAHLVGECTSPSRAVERAELLAKVEDALESLEPIDREVLSLRHFEELSNADTAAILGIERRPPASGTCERWSG